MDLIPKSEIFIKTEAPEDSAAFSTNNLNVFVETKLGYNLEVKSEAVPTLEAEEVDIKQGILDFKVPNKEDADLNIKVERLPTEVLQTKDDVATSDASKCYRCDVCDYTATSLVKLTWHKRIHSNKTVYSCNECAYKTTKKDCFLRHAIIHTNKISCICKICGYNTTQKHHYRRHMLSHMGEKPFQCTLCDYRTVHKHHLKRHILTHNSRRLATCNQQQICKKLLKCDKCNYRTVVERNFKMHIPTHIDTQDESVQGSTKSCAKDDLKCKVCGFTAVFRSSLKRHMVIHKPKKSLKCKVCDFQTVYKSNLLKHEANHLKGKLFKCKICGFRTSVKNNYQMHLPTHLEGQSECLPVFRYKINDLTCLEKTFRCHLCEYRTKQKYHLKRHIITHFREKPFKCRECNYQTAYKRNLLAHEKSHLMGKVFRCSKCNYKTTVRSNFDMHTHNVKPLKSPVLFRNVNVPKRTVLQHKKKHSGSGKEIYKCNMCSYKTVTKHLFEMHTPTHRDEGREFLHSVFSSESNLCGTTMLEGQKHKKDAGDKYFKCLKCQYRTTVERNFKMHIHSSAADTKPADVSTSRSCHSLTTGTNGSILTSCPITVGAADIGLNPSLIYIAAPLQTLDQNYGYQIQTLSNVINYANYYQ